jgi:hypothetical protein
LKFGIEVGFGERMSGKEFWLPGKITWWPNKVGPIVFILGKNIARYKDQPYGRRSAEIINSY